MRAIERIKPFLNFIDGSILTILDDLWHMDMSENQRLQAMHDIQVRHDDILDYWLKNQDMRFSQVLINMGIIPNQPGSWYYIEEDEILEFLRIPHRDFLLWGQYYDKDMKRLDKPVRKPIKELDTEHIKAIVDGEYTQNKTYLKCFKEELKLREEKP